jgi:hypothetical protein
LFTNARGIAILRLTNEQVLAGDYGTVHGFVQRFPESSETGEA